MHRSGAGPDGVDLLVGGRLLVTAQTKQGLGGGHGRPASVEPEDELVEVDLQMLGGHAFVGALQPALQVADGSVDAGQDVVEVFDRDSTGSLRAGVMAGSRVW